MTATWTAPKTMAHEPTIYSDWNTYVRDNLEYLKQDTSAQIFMSAGAMSPQGGGTIGCAALVTTTGTANMVDYQSLDFDASIIEYAQSPMFTMPSDYNGGQMSYKVLWTHGSTTTNFKVGWALQAIAYGDNQNIDTAWGTAVQVNDTGGTTNYVYLSPSGTITSAGSPASGCAMKFRVQRVATDGTNDTLAIDAKLLGIQVTYTRN
jgi:hypothetical protein